MKLNFIERLIVNSPLVAAKQRYWELPALLKLAPFPPQARVLEIGCGRGHGLRLLWEQQANNIKSLTGCDLDPAQIERSKAYLAKYDFADQTELTVADAAALPFANSNFDVVFCFGSLHHVPQWQAAIAEIKRVLAPQGILYTYEFYAAAINNLPARILFDHPRENRFNHAQLIAESEKAGLKLLGEKNTFDLVGFTALQRQ